MEHKEMTDADLVKIFNNFYKECKNISETTPNKLSLFLKFYFYYILVMDRFEQKISRTKFNRTKTKIEKNEIIERGEKIREGITNRKKEIDKILSKLDAKNKHKILPALVKKSENNKKLVKNVANNRQIKYNFEQLNKNEAYLLPPEQSELNILRSKNVINLTNSEANRLKELQNSEFKNELLRYQENINRNLPIKQNNPWVFNNNPSRFI